MTKILRDRYQELYESTTVEKLINLVIELEENIETLNEEVEAYAEKEQNN